MGSSDRFLALYKEYESLLRDTGRDPKQQEEAVAGVPADRLRMLFIEMLLLL